MDCFVSWTELEVGLGKVLDSYLVDHEDCTAVWTIEEGVGCCENIIYEFTSLRSGLIPSQMFSITLLEVLHRGGLPYRRKADHFDPKFTFLLLF